MFTYFGYGSNMNGVSLSNKGVQARRTQAAVLENWRVAFNISHPFAFEGSVANIVSEKGSFVHGALCTCDDEYLGSLDTHEGLGVYYDRLALKVRTYEGDHLTAFAYVGTPLVVADEGLPSARYRNILLNGARTLGLAGDYLDWLSTLPTHAAPAYPLFVQPANVTARFTLAQVSGRPALTAVAGYVFDMSDAGPLHATLRSLFSGRDVTSFLLRLMNSSVDEESVRNTLPDRLSGAQRNYLNNCLHEFCNEYRYVGQLTGGNHEL